MTPARRLELVDAAFLGWMPRVTIEGESEPDVSDEGETPRPRSGWTPTPRLVPEPVRADG